jgi:hypothetical protein
MAAVVVAVASIVAASASGSPATAAGLPKACKLLTRAESAALTGAKMLQPVDGGSICIYNADPNGPSAQVQIVVTTDTPRTMQLDRKLGHKFKKIPGLGDEAYEEEWNIFVRKAKVWVAISLVAPNSWPAYEKPIQKAAALAISRLPAGASSNTGASAPVRVVGTIPAGGGSNPRWKGNEQRFGGSVGQLKGVVYQPDVVLIGGGAGAIRAVSGDGLTWTVSGRAPGVSRLAVGKIMLATTFAAGRVLKLEKKGTDVEVTLGPVSLTDVIRDGSFDSGGAVPLKQPLYYNQALPTIPPTSRRPAVVTAGGGTFTTESICCTNMGVAIHYDNGAGRMTAAVNLYLGAPTVDFKIRISGGKLREASLQLNGASALDYTLVAATKSVAGNVKSDSLGVPGSITVPLAGPLSLTLTQAFDVSLQLSGAATMSTSGAYAVSGGLGFAYRNGSFTADATSMATKKPMEYNTASVGSGTNAFSLGWALKATVGVGLGGFTAGAWTKFKSGLAVVQDGSPGSFSLGCVKLDLSVTGQVGVGYTIPNYALKIVNSVLGAVGAKPIQASGGPQSGEFTIWKPGPASACPKRKPGR